MRPITTFTMLRRKSKRHRRLTPSLTCKRTITFKCYVIGGNGGDDSGDDDCSVGQSIQRVLVHTQSEQMLYINCVV